MMNLRVWNIRGLNKIIKQKEVLEVINSNNLGLCAILESHVSEMKLKKVCGRIFRSWDWVSNNSSCKLGTRTIVGWNANKLDLMVLSHSNQVMHCFVRFLDSNFEMYFSFINVASRYIERRLLWKNLEKHKVVVKNKAWVLLGDFNVAMKPSEYSECSLRIPKGVADFIECINSIEVEDINCLGL